MEYITPPPSLSLTLMCTSTNYRNFLHISRKNQMYTRLLMITISIIMSSNKAHQICKKVSQFYDHTHNTVSLVEMHAVYLKLH